MTAATLMAVAAGALAVVAAWEALAALEREAVARAASAVLEPLRAVRRAGREPQPAERRRLAIVGAGALLAGGWLLAGPMAGAVAAAAGPAAVARLLAARRARWRAELSRGAPAAARALADALAAGHAVRGAVAVAARDGGLRGAAGVELRSAAAALALGEPTDGVLERLRGRARDAGWDAIVAAVLLQRDAGGDLAALLRAIAGRLEEAVRVEADARTATTQARLTARMVLALPLGAVVLGELAAPGTVRGALADPRAFALAAGAAALQIAAMGVVRRLSRVPA